MPTVGLDRDLLFAALGEQYSGSDYDKLREKFDHLCFEFGIELDEVVLEEGKEIYKIDIPANRYDLLCLEGLVRALRVFLSLEPTPSFKTIIPSEAVSATTKMIVRRETKQIRPYVVCAILRNLKLDEVSYQSCLDLQDQLHRNICRRRTLVAIGTHDMDAIEGPFTYEARAPSDIKFQHLFADQEQTGKEMLDWFRTDPAGKHIKEYTNIIYDSPVYPVIYDKNRTVLSLPPIINGVASKIGPETRNMFIECTATDLTKAKIVINTIVAMFSRYCAEPESVEGVRVEYDEGVIPGGEKEAISSMVTPDLSTHSATARVKEVCSTIGVDISPEDMTKLCEKMQLGPASLDDKKETVTVTVPITRSDILHECDIIEDIAIAYGYNNVPKTVPPSHRPGKELAVNLLSDLLRHEISRQGYTEILSLGLCSREENFAFLKRTETPETRAVTLANPKTIEYQVVRTSLIPGILKTLAHNRSQKFSTGVRLFEVSDIVVQGGKTPMQRDIGCRNERRLSALHAGLVSNFEEIHGLVDRLMQVLAIVPAKEYCPEAAESKLVQQLIADKARIGEYIIEACSEDMYLPGHAGAIKWKRLGSDTFVEVGRLGVLHPDVLKNFGIKFPCTVLEMTIEPFIRE